MENHQPFEPTEGQPKQQKSSRRSASEIQAWLISYLSNLLEIKAEEIDLTIPFERYGLDSEAAIVLSGELQEWLNCELDPILLFDYPTIQALSQHLAQPEQN